MTWVDDVISEGESILADFSREKAAYYISRSLSLLSDCGVEKQRAGMQTQKQRVGRISARGSWSTPGPDDDDYLEDAKTLVLRFKRIKVEIESGEKGAGGTVFNIDAHSENANTANASATAMATMSYAGACAAVDGLDLDEDEKDELIDLLNDARKAKDDKTLLAAAVQALIANAFEYGIETPIAVWPFVLGLLQSGAICLAGMAPWAPKTRSCSKAGDDVLSRRHGACVSRNRMRA